MPIKKKSVTGHIVVPWLSCTINSGIILVCKFKSWLLQIWCNFLLQCLSRQRMVEWVLGSCYPCGDLDGVPESWPHLALTWALSSSEFCKKCISEWKMQTGKSLLNFEVLNSFKMKVRREWNIGLASWLKSDEEKKKIFANEIKI